MRIFKIISLVLHPIVMPTVGLLLYLILVPLQIPIQHQYLLLSVIFLATYIIPLLLLLFLRALGQIETFELQTIRERKFPIIFMIFLLFFTGRVFYDLPHTRDISYLFYSISLGLTIVHLLFTLNIKTSLHLLGMGGAIGYLMIFQIIYHINVLPIIAIFFILSGIVASARLHLKAHTTKEIYLGFFIGILSQFMGYYIF